MQTAGSSSSAAAAASPLPSADAGEEEHTGQVDSVMIVVCRQFVIAGIVVIVAVVAISFVV